MGCGDGALAGAVRAGVAGEAYGPVRDDEGRARTGPYAVPAVRSAPVRSGPAPVAATPPRPETLPTAARTPIASERRLQWEPCLNYVSL